MAHQIVGSLHGRNGNAGYEVLIAAHLCNRLTDHLHRLQDTVPGVWMRGKYDGISRLDGNLSLVKCRRCRIGRRDQSGDHTDRNCQSPHLSFLIPADFPYGFHVFDMFIYAVAGEHIFNYFISFHAESRLFVGHPGQALCIPHAGIRD